MQYEELLAQFKLLGGILKQPDNTELDERLAHLTRIIEEKIPDTLKKNAPPNYYELYMDFKSFYEQFRNFVLYDRLIGKNVVALGGGFSSGKSSFLNALDGENALPISIDPSTAVPTFIVNGEKHESFGINIFNARVPIGLRDIRAISHGFGEIRDEDGGVAVKSVTLGHVIRSVFLASPKQRYANLAFVDTPGFSKPDSDTYSARTDEYISRGQLNSGSYILMFIQADAGTLKDEDIRFIKSLREDIPKLFVVSKADVKSGPELTLIVDNIKSQLTYSGVPNLGVLTFSSNKPEEYDGAAIRSILSGWNETRAVPQFSRNFKKLFIGCRKYYEQEIEDERRRLDRLNTSLTRLREEDAETLEPLRLLVKEIQASIGKLRDVYENLKNLKDEFFLEMKRVCDQIGVYMPEPSEADMADDSADPLELLRAYKKENGIRTSPETLELLREILHGVVPAFDKAAGGSANRDAMVSLIREYCRVDAGNIRINDVTRQAGDYEAAIKDLDSNGRKAGKQA